MMKEKSGAEKNQAAVALARLRSERLSPERRREIARKAAIARAAALSASKRKIISDWANLCKKRLAAKRKATATLAE
jgi:hypothetical protein